MVSASSDSRAAPKAAQFAGDDLWDKSWTESFGESTIRTRSTVDNTARSFTLYSSWFCPFAQRAWIAAEESGANYEWTEINPYQVDPTEKGGYTKKALPLERKQELFPGFVEASPRGLVPALRHHDSGNDLVIWESLPVAEYIDQRFGDGKLVPTNDPYSKAMVQIWSAHCTERIQKNYYGALMAQEDEERQKYLQIFYNECRALARAMKPISEESNDNERYFLGSQFTLVDVALAPFWQRMIWVGGHYFGLIFPEEAEFARLAHWWDAVQKRPSVQATLVCKERLIASYSDYARNAGTSDFALTFRK